MHLIVSIVLPVEYALSLHLSPSVVHCQSSAIRHEYEEVNLTFNPRYLGRKSHTSGLATPTPDLCVGNPLQQSPTGPEAGIYSYVECGKPGAAVALQSSTTETDTYEVMKPSASVKTSLATTAHNV